MERQQQQQQSTLCREGCGFFGSAATEGYCSKCYMDHLRRKQSHQHATSTSGSLTDALCSTSSELLLLFIIGVWWSLKDSGPQCVNHTNLVSVRCLLVGS